LLRAARRALQKAKAVRTRTAALLQQPAAAAAAAAAALPLRILRRGRSLQSSVSVKRS
jgi:hypothetical protein